MKVGDAFGILYSSRFASEGFKRFNVAHELGHYFLPGHIDALFANGQQFHQSESGFTSDDKYEREADSFAASLLMPKMLFKAECAKCGEGLDAIETLADLCITSLTATAIRFAKLCDDPVAVVCSKGDRVQFAFMSKPLQDYRGLTWIRKGSGLPAGTATAKPAFGDPARVLRYLGRYTHRVAISNQRLLSFDGHRVSFRWKDYAHGNKHRIMTLTASEFLRRFCQHVLPRGFVRIRHFGYLANARRAALIALARQQLACQPPTTLHLHNPPLAIWHCPRCGANMNIGPNLTPPQLAFRCKPPDSS